ncbi:MAG: ABC transporter ATP-binding protein [Chloroflexota bacterium]|nr:ABC transporter ATP-binding protein [Chloroflexota bacterium]
MTPTSQDVLEVHDLRVYFHTRYGPVKAVDGVSFRLRQGERFGLVGESGSGKSTTGLAILRMIKPPGKIEGGEIRLAGVDVLGLSEPAMRQTRLGDLALVAQGAMNSLNPVMRVGDQIVDALQDHGVRASRKDFADRIGVLFERVGLRRDDANRFPHELSGGMKQRVCIALAISLQPKVIVADEPTSALDVVVQRQVMDTLTDVQTDLGAAVILIGHDMGLMAQFVDRLGVMYAGELVEVSPMDDVYAEPLHPYTRLLIACLPSLEQKGLFAGIPGLPPSLLDPPSGCPFNPRCPHVMERCRIERPLLQQVASDRWVACHLFEGVA